MDEVPDQTGVAAPRTGTGRRGVSMPLRVANW